MADREKEAWPGAGIPLDFLYLRIEDPERVAEHLARMPDAQARQKWLERLYIELDRAKSQIRDRPGIPVWSQLQRADEMRQRCLAVHTYLTKIEELEAKSQEVEETEPARDSPEFSAARADQQLSRKATGSLFTDLESLRRELENVDYSDQESVKRELQNYESPESKLHFLAIAGMAIKHEFAEAEKEWVAAGQSFESPLRANVTRWEMAQGKILPWIIQTMPKYRCWIGLRTGKELWPGAGIDLDLKNIRDDDLELFELIEERLNSLPDYKDRIAFLKRFVILLRHESGMGENDHGSASKGAQHLHKKCESAIRMFEQLAELEMSLDSQTSRQGAREIEDDPPGPTWNNETAAIALYALLRMAGLPEDRTSYNQTEVAKFAHLLTRRSQKKMADFHLGTTKQSFSKEAAEEVAEQFEKMGLADLAKELRKFYKTGTGFQGGSGTVPTR